MAVVEMNKIELMARFAIKESQLEVFRQVAGACLNCVRDKDRGTLRYDLYFSGDYKAAILHEAYADSNALMGHLDNLGDLIEELSAVADITVEVFGEPSGALLDRLGGATVPVYTFEEGMGGKAP